MLFDPGPKERKSDFFNNEVPMKDLTGMLTDRHTRCVAVLGPRRTGKTSLMKVTLNELGLPHVFIDGRSVEGKEDFFRKLSIKAPGALGGTKLSAIEMGARLEFGNQDDITSRLKGKRFILAIDEAQWLSQFGLAGFLAYLYDNEKGIKLLLSGSEAGLLQRFLGRDDADSPLFGRAIETVRTIRLSREEGRNFLRLGAKGMGMQISDDEISGAIDNLDGIIGWLTLYGWQRRSMAHQKALAETVRQGVLLTQSEFENFLSSKKAKKKYFAVMNAIAAGARSWSQIKAALERRLGFKVSDSQLADYLNTLSSHEFISKGKDYEITDPLLKKAFE